MDKLVLKGFADELQKQGKLMPWTRFKGVTKRFLTKRKAAKDIYKQVSDEAASILKQDPTANIKHFMSRRMRELKTEGAVKGLAQEKAILEGGSNVKPKGFVSKHKKGLILGGAAIAGGAYLMNSGESEEEKQRRLMMEQVRRYQ